MILRPDKLLFCVTIVIGIALATSATNWYIAWFGLELNLISFFPLLLSNKDYYHVTGAFQYFLVQALASSILLTGALLTYLISRPLLFCGLVLKTGGAPLHFWFISVREKLSWFNFLVLRTVQKIAPLRLLSHLINRDYFIIFIIISIISGLVGALGGINQLLLRTLIAYSSLRHLGWILAAISSRISCWIFYFRVYCFTSRLLILILKKSEVYFLVQFLLFSGNPIRLLGVWIRFLSMRGIPPFLGFFPKIEVIERLVCSRSILWAYLLTVSSLIALFFYLRLLFVIITLIGPKIKHGSKHDWGIGGSLILLNLFICIIPIIVY